MSFLRRVVGFCEVHSCFHSTPSTDPTQLPKNIQRRGMALEQARITKAINQNVERVSSARALKAGDTFSMQDVKRIGKEMNRDMRREELSRKKSRVEEKLAELQAKVEEAS